MVFASESATRWGSISSWTRNRMQGLQATLMMITVQAATAGVNIFYKLASNNGMDLSILIAYRFMFATAFILPLALIMERKTRPKLTWMILFQAFFAGLFGGSMAQNTYLKSLVLTSATFASAFTNLIPPLTFLLALLFRLEKFRLSTTGGKAKVVGLLVGVGGATLLTFYKGVELNWSTHIDLLHDGRSKNGSQRNSILGPIVALISAISTALGLLFQAKLSASYPCPYSSTALISIMGSIQAVVYAICKEQRWIQWKLVWNIRLLAVFYTALASALVFTFQMSCMHMRGPLFVAVFNPLGLVLVAIAGSLLLDEKLHLGSVIGSVIIIAGLYMVLWGKSKETRELPILMPSTSSDDDFEVRENDKSTTNVPSEGGGHESPEKDDRGEHKGEVTGEDNNEEVEKGGMVDLKGKLPSV